MWQSRIEIADYSDMAKNYCKVVFHSNKDQKFAVLLF